MKTRSPPRTSNDPQSQDPGRPTAETKLKLISAALSLLAGLARLIHDFLR